MNIDTYQSQALRTMNKGLPGNEALTMTALGLAGEAGEVVDLVKKVLFHGHKIDKAKLAAELGDVLWYVANMASALGLDLSEVAAGNVDKLRKRYPAGFTEAASRDRVD